MNEEMFQQLMADVDPSRDITDATLDSLVSQGHLMQRIAAGLEEGARVRTRRVPLWRRGPALVGEGVAALTAVVVAALTLFASTPAATSWSFSASLPASITHSPRALIAYSSSASFLNSLKSLQALHFRETNSQALVTGADVVDGRFVRTVSLDHGALIISPAPSSLTTGMPVASEAANMWATSQLDGYREQVIGFGIATLTAHTAAIHGFKNVPSFIALATSSGDVFHCPSMPLHHKTIPTPTSNGEAAVVVATPGESVSYGSRIFQAGIAYIAASAPCGSLVKPRLTLATEQLSLPWNQTAPIKHGRMPIAVRLPACGGDLSGYSVTGNAKSLVVTAIGSVDEGLFDLMCPAGMQVREVLKLVPADGESLATLVTPSTKIVHARTGPIQAAQK